MFKFSEASTSGLIDRVAGSYRDHIESADQSHFVLNRHTKARANGDVIDCMLYILLMQDGALWMHDF